MSSLEKSQQHQQTDQQAIIGAEGKKKSYLLVSNPSKTTHLGTLLRCAAAFQVHQVLLVGYDKFNCQGSFGSHSFLDILVFPSWGSVRDYLRRGGDYGGNDKAYDNDSKPNANDDQNDDDQNEQRNSSTTNEIPASEERKNVPHSITTSSPAKNPITIIGILGACGGGEEIFSSDGMALYEDLDKKFVTLVAPKNIADPTRTHHNQDSGVSHRSFPISSRPFTTDVCFILSKDKRGLPPSQARICTGFVHVPHLSFDDDAPLPQISNSNNSTSPTSIQSVTTATTPSNLLDTATTLSIVLHHFTAWARYTERTFEGNQKFVKDIKPNDRRRLCRRMGGHNERRNISENRSEPESTTEQEAMDAMKLWSDNVDASKGSDY